MSGHSKWSKVKHQKAVNDVVKSSQFTKASRAITVAVVESGGLTNPDMNFRLRLAIDKARAINMPKDKIARACQRATGVDGSTLDRILFEGYGPYKSAFLIEALTDNRNRAVSAIKNLLERSGGTMASPAAVGFLFKKTGIIVIPRFDLNLDAAIALALISGADDVAEVEDHFEFYTSPESLSRVHKNLEDQGREVVSSEMTMIPISPLMLDAPEAKVVTDLIEHLEELDDVEAVFTNLA